MLITLAKVLPLRAESTIIAEFTAMHGTGQDLRVMEQLDGSKILVGVALLTPVLLLDLCHHPLQLGHLLLLAGHRPLHSHMFAWADRLSSCCDQGILKMRMLSRLLTPSAMALVRKAYAQFHPNECMHA